ncbi:RHS repeat-associated core domain-containing protein [Alloactinosynnema sp. L-07]|uniref:RHS repeat-associated core domain-containing protein n=1 Tax=Alloactinosynnema sp. L-07 TaxID=1653480 RepID=UPI0009EF600F|nr:RHS repeat-associated core domain-containing protein [Alloactinosynnema sp. L-07]
MPEIVLPAAAVRPRWRLRLWVIVVVLALAATTVTALSLPSSPEPELARSAPVDKLIPHDDVHPNPVPLAHREPSGIRKESALPGGGSATVRITAAGESATARASALPVSLAAVEERSAGEYEVRMQEPAAAQRAGVHGALLAVTPRSENARSVKVTVHYADFRYAAGGDFGARLRLVQLPACAMSTPEAPNCQEQRPLEYANDPGTETVTTKVDFTDAQPMVMAAVGSTSGANGTYEASSLSPSGTWSVGGNTGSFSWSYPISMPPVAAGSAPSIKLSYDSSKVDGLTSGTNNQSSWIGQGWEYSPGFIERTYRACKDDTALPAAQKTPDLCWAGHLLTLSLNGKSTQLVFDDATQTWRPASDDGARVEQLTGAVNGAHNGEYWKITTTDGVQYFFGRNSGPGHTSQETTNSAWTVPIHGANGGAVKAWRWNLDFIRDPDSNTTAYYYAPETNYYGAANATTGVQYVRGGTLKRIDYGMREANGSIYTETVPGQVVFETAERCIPSGSITCDPSQFTTANAAYWPDTPVDQQCLAAAVCNNHAPTFWSTKRLTAIKTQYNVGNGPIVVDRYQLTHSVPAAIPAVVLDSIVRTGYDATGASVTTPPVSFTSQAHDNRVVGYHNAAAMPFWRMSNIRTETGSDIKITYSPTECTSTNVPGDPANVDKRCFPVFRYLPYEEEPILDYYHKYVVIRVEVQDTVFSGTVAQSPTQRTDYTYLGAPAFHFDDNELVKPHHRTYGQFRGYAKVETRTGVLPERQTLTRSTYFRGMHDDTLPGGGKRSVAVANSLGESVTDTDQFAGTPFETQTFDGDGGTQISTSVNNPSLITTTASRSRAGLPAQTAAVVATTRSRAVTNLASGGVRTTSTVNQVDDLGRVVSITESADGLPDLCTTNAFAENLTSWIRDRLKQTTTSQQACPTGGTPQANILSASKTYYDNAAHGVVTGAGHATRTETATANSSGTLTFEQTSSTVYDGAGRPTSLTNALGKVSTIAYTPAAGGILSQIRNTNPKNQSATVHLEPSRGLTVATIDLSSRRTDVDYDALGRLTAVWMPGRAKAPTTDPNVRYEYLLRNDGHSAVTTKKLVDYNTGTNYVTSIKLFDSIGQPRQIQTDDVSDPNGVSNRVAATMFYDSHGWVVSSNNRFATTGTPSTTLASVPDASVDDRTSTTYDGTGRPVAVTALRGLTAVTTTNTVHGGDRITTIPPQGGVTTTAVTDARGRNTALLHYTAAPTVNGNSVTGGAAQTTGYHFSALGWLEKMTDHAGNEWRYEYDFLGRQTARVDPDAGRTTTAYDLGGRITSTTDGRGQALSFTYDDLDRKTVEYSGIDLATRVKLASWNYDTAQYGVGKLAYSTRHTPTGDYRVGVTGYNPAGLPWDQVIGVPTSETGLSGNHKTTFAFTSTGLPRRITPPTKGGLLGEDLNTTYDRHGNPRTMTSPSWDYVSGSTVNAFSEPVALELAGGGYGGTLSIERDSHTHRLTRSTLSSRGAWPQVDDLAYTFDPFGNVKRIVNVQGHPQNNAPVRTQCFDYDALARLSKAWTATDNCAAAAGATTVGGPTPYWRSWEFDALGLRTREVQHALPGSPGGDTSTMYTYPAPGGVRPHAVSATSTATPGGTTGTSYTYDAAGNTLTRVLPAGSQTLTWNENNRLAKIATPAGDTTYVYDADGNQLIRREPGTTTLYLPGQEWARNTSTGAITGTRYYSHAGQVIAMRVAGGNVQYLHADHHGTAQVAMNAVGFAVTRRELDPYGNALGAAQGGPWPDNHGFLGKPTNPTTGLSDIGARKYDPTLGRFISVDPLLIPADPQSWAGYTYANNNPTTASDPTGLFCDGCESRGSGDNHGVGCSMDTSGGCDSQEDVQYQHQVETGTGDGLNQPVIHGHRLPTRQDMQRGVPGRPTMMKPGETYEQAIVHWATYFCNSGKAAPGFCEWSYTIGNRPANEWDALLLGLNLLPLGKGANLAISQAVRAGVRSVGTAVRNGIRRALHNVNKVRGTQNCSSCVVAGDATLAGHPASAIKLDPDVPIPYGMDQIEARAGSQWRWMPSRATIEYDLISAGNGARGIVYGARADGTAHTWNAVVKNGRVKFIDYQIGRGRAASFDGYTEFAFIRTG